MLKAPRGRRVFGAALVLLGLAIAPLLARAAGANLLANPGFEDSLPDHAWMPAGWDTSRSGTETVLFARDDFAAHTGRYGVSAASASIYLPFWHNWSQTIDATPAMWGKDIVVSVWTRNNGVEGRGYVLVQTYRDTVGKMARQWKIPRGDAASRLMMAGVNDPITGMGWQRVSFAERETEWTERKLRVHVAPSVNIITIRLGIFGIGQVLYDDASATLEEAAPAVVPPLHTNLLEDPGFEGNGMVWETHQPPFPDVTAERDTTRAHTGKVSMHFNCERGIITGKMGAGQVFCNRALAGKRIRMTAYAKAESLASNIFLHLYCHTSESIKVIASTPKVSGNQDWSPLVVEMDVPDNTYMVWAWVEYTAPVKGHAYCDDATFEVLGPATGEPTPSGAAPPSATKAATKSTPKSAPKGGSASAGAPASKTTKKSKPQ